jgi:hypothetical protein
MRFNAVRFLPQSKMLALIGRQGGRVAAMLIADAAATDAMY